MIGSKSWQDLRAGRYWDEMLLITDSDDEEPVYAHDLLEEIVKLQTAIAHVFEGWMIDPHEGLNRLPFLFETAKSASEIREEE